MKITNKNIKKKNEFQLKILKSYSRNIGKLLGKINKEKMKLFHQQQMIKIIFFN
jgi:hypothetical protein